MFFELKVLHYYLQAFMLVCLFVCLFFAWQSTVMLPRRVLTGAIFPTNTGSVTVSWHLKKKKKKKGGGPFQGGSLVEKGSEENEHFIQ